MTQTYSLDRVIRRIDHPDDIRGTDGGLVTIDARKRRVLPRPPLVLIGRDIRFYAVFNSHDPRNTVSRRLMAYSPPSLEHDISMSVDYEVSCPAGNEERVAMTLFHEADSTDQVFERYLARWLTILMKEGARALVTQYVNDRTLLERRLSDMALSDTGLDLSARLSLDAERSLSSITVVKEHMRVIVSDFYDNEQDLSVRVTVEVDEQNTVNAVLAHHNAAQIQELVPREILRYIRNQVTMQSFCTELHMADFRGRLAAALNVPLVPFGRKIGTIALSTQAPGILQYYHAEVPVICNLHEYVSPVIINNRVEMILREAGQYMSAQAPPLKEWVQEQLDRIVPHVLFKARYIDVLIRFPEYEKAIKERLSVRADEIGYEVEHLVTIPDLEPITWMEPFSMEPSGSFETKQPKVYVKLQFAVIARIPNLATVEKYLTRNQHIPRLMEDAILQTVRQCMHSIEPERFYMRFNYSPLPDESSVEAELVKRISSKLQTDFGAEVIDVVVKAGETEIMARLKALQETICPFEVRIDVQHFGEPLVFRGNFQVDSVDGGRDGWLKFQSSAANVETIRRLLEEHIASEFDSLTPDQLMYRDPLHRKRLQTQLQGLAIRFVRQIFGLMITITNVRRDRTAAEADNNRRRLLERQTTINVEIAKIETWQTAEVLATQDRLKRLEGLIEQRRLLAGNTGVEEELASLDRQIEKEQAGLRPERMLSVDEVDHALLPPAPPGTTLDALSRLTGISDFVPPAPRQLNGETE